jgi:hypothetical protein
MMERKYLAFDIEIAAEIPEGATDWKEYRPLGITCAATLPGDGDPSLWFGIEEHPNLAPRMTREEVCDLVRYLQSAVAKGYTILTWNGLSFDFDVIAEESGMHAECAELALHHVDMMFHVFCLRGHYLGLDKVAKGLGLPGKTAGMDGAKAPQMWADGKFAEVLEYVAQDVRTTLDVALKVEEIGLVEWTSQKGRRNFIDIAQWLTVTEAQALPLPDTSWMTNPVDRGQFTAWIGA